jgi:hypothetical protein
MNHIVRSVVARWNFKVAMSEFRPEIPEWIFERYATKTSLQSNPAVDLALFKDGKDSINVLLPNLINLFRKTMGDRYSMNASQRQNDIFYYFSPPQPIDAFTMHLGCRGGKLFLDMGYIPYDFHGKPDRSKVIEVQEVVEDSELVGLHMMGMARRLLAKIRK